MSISLNTTEQSLLYLGASKDDLQSSLEGYFNDISNTVSKSNIEWNFIKLIIGCDTLKPVDNVPYDELLSRVSGVALLFIYSQYTNIEIDFCHEFDKLLLSPYFARDYYSHAWSINPKCRLLYNIEFRKRFVRWLSKSNKSLGSCLIAEASRDDAIEELLNEIACSWINTCFYNEETPAIIAEALNYSSLRSACQKIIKKCASISSNDLVKILSLMRSAYAIIDYKSVISLGEIVLELKVDNNTLEIVCNLRISSLIELDRELEAIEEYKTKYQSMNWSFPYPEKLLFVFQSNGLTDLENHLLDHCSINEKTEDWVRLHWLDRGRHNKGALLNQWIELYTQKKNDLRILYGFSSFLVNFKISNPLAMEWKKRIFNDWTKYKEYEDYRELSSAFLVLLASTNFELTEAYEKYFSGSELQHPIARKAAQAYIRALTYRKQWNDLRSIITQQRATFILAISQFDEYEFIHNMAMLEKLPSREKSNNKASEFTLWCRQWERLISLPLECEMLMQVIDHFNTLEQRLLSDFPEATSHPLYTDIKLQLLRRAKAEAEQQLNSLNHNEILKKRGNLLRADLGNIIALLRSLRHEFREDFNPALN